MNPIVHRTTIRRVIPGPVPGARPWVLPAFDNDSGQAVSARVLDSHEGKPASGIHTSGASVAPASNSTPRAVRGCPTTATASQNIPAAGAAATPCRTDAAYTNTNGGSAAD